jgi:hypothetical protein
MSESFQIKEFVTELCKTVEMFTIRTLPSLEEQLYLDIVCFILGDSPASGVYMSKFRNRLSVPC